MHLRHVSASLLVLAAAASPIAGCGSDSGSSAAKSGGSPPSKASGASGSVSISDFAFKPSSVTVRHGKAVTIANHDTTAHTATADDGRSFDTGDIDPGASKTVTVSKPGTYKFHCTIHPFMHGTLVVK
jgi:plastocyanin